MERCCRWGGICNGSRKVKALTKPMLKTAATASVIVLAGLMATGCATKGYVNEQVAGVDSRVTEVQGTAGEALARAQAAHKLAEGKFLYEVVLSDDSVKFPTDKDQPP